MNRSPKTLANKSNIQQAKREVKNPCKGQKKGLTKQTDGTGDWGAEDTGTAGI